MKPRVKNLLENFLSKRNEVCFERATLITKAYKKFRDDEIHKKRAKVLEYTLNNISTNVYGDELIVGNIASKGRAAPVFPEFSWGWIMEELDVFDKREADRFLVSDEGKRVLEETLPWWKGRSVRERALSMMPSEVKESFTSGVFTVGNYLNSGVGHVVADYERAIKHGFNGIKKEIRKRINMLDLTRPDAIDRRNFYEAVIIALNAGISLSRRYANKARELAAKERNGKRKEELEKIAEICEWVPANPARTFWEALQAFWFTHIIFWIESNGNSVAPGRFDQYMFPYYEKDLEEGRITREKALELLECLYIKMSEIIKIYDTQTAKYFGGFPQGQIIILGGQTRHGEDSVNELSYLCIDAMKEVKTRQPNLAVRINNRTSDDFLLEVTKLVSLGTGQPELFNDETVIPSLLNIGVPLEDARDYAMCGCAETAIPGKTNTWGVAAMINFGKCLELALNDGRDPLTGKQLGPKTGDPLSFESFDEVLEAYRRQVDYASKMVVIAQNCIQKAHRELAPQPFLSAFISDCIESGRDFIAGGAHYNFSGPQGVGTAVVADSLAAIKKFVFETDSITVSELVNALEENFGGEHEGLRLALLRKVPKFGNDEDYVDLMAREVAKIHCVAYRDYCDPRGGNYTPGFVTNTAGIMFGAVTGATPDGRRLGDPLSDGVSPVAGRDIRGPTAVYKSVGKIDFKLTPQGAVLNLKFNPELLNSDERIRKFIALFRTFFDLGGFHVQFNVVSDEILKDAQKHPEKHPGLLVRVAGWCAYFVELAKPVQDEIIARCSHSKM